MTLSTHLYQKWQWLRSWHFVPILISLRALQSSLRSETNTEERIPKLLQCIDCKCKLLTINQITNFFTVLLLRFLFAVHLSAYRLVFSCVSIVCFFCVYIIFQQSINSDGICSNSHMAVAMKSNFFSLLAMCCHIARGLTVFIFFFFHLLVELSSASKKIREPFAYRFGICSMGKSTQLFDSYAPEMRERTKKCNLFRTNTRYCLCVLQYNCLFSSSISCNSPKRLTGTTKEAACKIYATKWQFNSENST